ncbi:MAG: biopolymer transporter ExbD [Gammaproteobacteria bacterium]|nr:biopolymer transporter ExbD [Gammaproteobacteria bacterium]
MRRSHTEDDYAGVSINVVPLIDVMFFLVLFFVATASFVKESGVDVNRPSAQTAATQEKANIVVTVTRSGEVWVGGRRVDMRTVRAEVERLAVENPDSTVVVAADGEASTRLLVAALDQVRLAGVTNVAIAAAAADAGP